MSVHLCLRAAGLALTVVAAPSLRAQSVADSVPASSTPAIVSPAPATSAAPVSRNTVTLMGGGMIYGLGGDGTSPYVSVRFGRDITSMAVVEGSAGYSKTREEILIFSNTYRRRESKHTIQGRGRRAALPTASLATHSLRWRGSLPSNSPQSKGGEAFQRVTTGMLSVYDWNGPRPDLRVVRRPRLPGTLGPVSH